MRKLVLTALAAALALSLHASTAGAASGIAYSPSSTTLPLNNMSISGPLGIDIICNFTLDFSLHARVVKRSGSLAGFADIAVSTGGCSEGNFGILRSGTRVTGAQGPYHVTYISFEGTLPQISSIMLQINDVELWQTLGSLSCLTAGAIDISVVTTGGNPATGVAMVGRSVAWAAGGLCSYATGEMNGSGSLSPAVTITLF